MGPPPVTTVNPFTERGRITHVERFTGRWGELSRLYEAAESRRPVLISGGMQIGKSSLLTHVVQSAAVALDLPRLDTIYLNLAEFPDPAAVYRVISEALGSRGDTSAALEVALLERGHPLFLCVDDAHTAVQAGWGDLLLENLARMARGGVLMLAVVVRGEPPVLSERFQQIRLGAFADTEVRLLLDAYLFETGVQFSPGEQRALAVLSMGHPAYLQRAAFHLFRAHTEPGYDWRAAYLAEARERPIPDAPLPPAIFESDEASEEGERSILPTEEQPDATGPERMAVPEPAPLLLWLAPLLAAALMLWLSNNILAARLAGALIGALAIWWQRR